MKKAILVGCVLVAAACGGKNNENSGTNNTTANNTTDSNNSNNTSGTNNTNNTNNTTGTNNTVVDPNPYRLFGACSQLDYDEDGDMVTDALQVKELNGPTPERATAIVTDLGADGDADSASRSTWDNQGRELTRDEDLDGDHVWDRHVEWDYNRNGALLSLILDEGDVLGAFTFTATYDDNGKPLVTERDGTFDEDGNITPADGTPDYVDTRTYNGATLATLTVDTDGDGTVDYSLTNTFDVEGKRTRFERDGIYDFDTGELIRAADGTPDTIWTFTFDVANHIIELTQDGDVGEALAQSDGTIDRYERNRTFDAMDHIAGWEFDGRQSVDGVYVSSVADGIWDGVAFTYDVVGNQTNIAVDEGLDGSDDVLVVMTYDSQGRVLTSSRDGVVDNDDNILTPADGIDDWIATTTYHASLDEVVADTIDADGDGVFEYTSAQEFDPNGNLTHFEVDGEVDQNEVVTPADGTADVELNLTYDDMDRLMSSSELLDGVQGQIATYAYGPCSDFL